MTGIVNHIKGTDPVERTYVKEYNHCFLSFCTLVCMLKNKKLNLANIFLIMLQEEKVRNIFKGMCDIDKDYDALKKFLQYDATLHKSKYIKNFLDANNFTLPSG
jgi:hypothetical protein